VRVATILISGLGFIVVLVGLVVLSIAGKDTSVYIGFATSAAVFLIPQLMGLLKAHSTSSDVQQIKHQTNGPLTRMQQQVDSIAAAVNEMNKGGAKE